MTSEELAATVRRVYWTAYDASVEGHGGAATANDAGFAAIGEWVGSALLAVELQRDTALDGVAHHRWCRACAEDGCASCYECRTNWPEDPPMAATPRQEG